MLKNKNNIEESLKNEQPLIEVSANDVQNQSAREVDNIRGFAFIDSRQLTRISLLHLLSELSPGKRREGDFIILPYSSSDEFVSDYVEHSWRVGMIVFNIGAAWACEDNISNEILLLKRELPGIPLVILSDRDELCGILSAFRNGVRGYILSSFDPSAVIQSLRLVMSGGTFIPHNVLMEIAEKTAGLIEKECQNDAPFDSAVFSSFTPRQLEVLDLLRKGKSNKFIAYELGMQECTVKTHVREIMTKLQATNRTHAVFLLSEITKEQS